MQRLINRPDEVVEDSVRGYVKANQHLLSSTDNPRVIKSNWSPTKGKVGIVTGGGSGHEPAFIGYVGKNLVDAVAIGEIFSSPSAKHFADAMRAANGGAGVACLYGNYAGDNMNVKMAVKMLKREGIEVKTVVANDDVASAPLDEKHKRRGVAGEILMWKVAGAAAAQGYDLDQVIAVAQKAIDNTLSVGIGLSSCTIPDVGHPNFNIDPGKMEIGIGHHGEPGVSVEDICSADVATRKMLDTILHDELFASGDEVVVLISGLGATPINELYIVYDSLCDMLDAHKITIEENFIGNLFTSLDMMGATLTMMKLDDELKQLVQAPCQSTGLSKF
ncbi:dihydroxyacetone kinase subunit DhaK [Aliagarivorans marinus]|uniref:dihydroxyacetone kinase subunit DhaK n=1 Tax=Aliagarivorans marinus TaxID=561965 RepID=UPI000424EB3C|nr:dihydroxyacetone kinase subunit DhaK [Aliagarivorans marinus]